MARPTSRGGEAARNAAVPGIAARMEEVVRRIRERAPEAVLLVNSVTPRTSFFAPRIRQLNGLYREIAERHGAGYVDLWPTLADSAGGIRPEFTTDNLHLSPAGYLAWAEVPRPHRSRFAVR